MRVVVKGGFLIRDITRALAEWANTTAPTYASLVVIYQINDRAMVTNDGPHVKEGGREAWLSDVSLFCKVLNIAAARAVVVTMDAACYPKFAKFEKAYDCEVEHLRQALTEHRVAWSRGRELVGQPTSDGWHFDATCLDTVAETVSKWLGSVG